MPWANLPIAVIALPFYARVLGMDAAIRQQLDLSHRLDWYAITPDALALGGSCRGPIRRVRQRVLFVPDGTSGTGRF
jgi:hypothetical protein